MATFLYGYNVPYSSAQMAFINVLLGGVLKFLFQLMPTLPWYTIAQVSLIWLSFVVLVYLLLKKFDGFKAIAPISALLLFFGYHYFSMLQFTKTASVAVIAGFSLLFYAIFEKKQWPTHLLAFYLLFVGSLFRMNAFLMFLIPFFGLGLYFVLPIVLQRDWKKIVRIAIPFVLIFCVCFGGRLFHQWYSRLDPAWEKFFDSNVARANLIDRGFPDYQSNKELYASLNITENDYLLYKSGNYADTELFTPEVMTALSNAKADKTINQKFFSQFYDKLVKEHFNYHFFPILGIALCFVLATLPNKNRRWPLLLTLYQILAFIGVQFYFFYCNRYLQSRVDINLYLAFFIILTLFGMGNVSKLFSTKRIAVGLAAVLLVTQFAGVKKLVDSAAQQVEERAPQEVLHQMILDDKEHFYFYSSNWLAFPDKMFDVWTVEPLGCGDNRSVLGTWRSQTPTIQTKWANFGIVNPYRDMIDNPRVYVICVGKTQINRIVKHAQDHYAPQASAVLVKTVENQFDIYQIVSES
jgi:hypothetical protein